MTTATEYRQYAQECIESARSATSEPVRKQFLDLAKLWLAAAARIDSHSIPLQPSKSDGHAPPDSASSAELAEHWPRMAEAAHSRPDAFGAN